jgi:hypothetical protein
MNMLRVAAVVMLVIAAALVYFVIAAVSSDGGAKPGVAVLYIIGAIALSVGASFLWRRHAPGPGPAA